VPTVETWTESEKVFRERWNFPSAVGAMDGKHIRIKCPAKSGSLHWNFKNFYSTVLLAVVDSNYNFLVAEIGAPGSQSDSGVLMSSVFDKLVSTAKINFPAEREIGSEGRVPAVILADQGFPLKEWMMKPFPVVGAANVRQAIFNYRLSRARVISENAFGILTARWRILLTSIDAKADLVRLIVRTIIVLHNYLRKSNDTGGISVDSEDDTMDGNWRENVPNNNQGREILRVGSNNYNSNASEIRDRFMNYFCSDEGSISKQGRIVMNGY